MDENRILCKFHWDCGRMGDLEGVFVTTQDKLEAAIGRFICFGEVLGKHSEVTGTLKREEVQVLSQDPDFIFHAERCELVPMGHNPLHYSWKENEGAKDWHHPEEEGE